MLSAIRKMKSDIKQDIGFADGVTAELSKNILKITGPKGSLARRLGHPTIALTLKDNQVAIEAKNATKREKKIIGTFTAHIKNMETGVTKGFIYKLKVCSGHFPINISFKDNTLSVKNFFGEHCPRNIKIKPGVELKIDGDLITVSGIDKEVVSQVAADIEQLTKRTNFDTRIYQDGIYIIDKNGKAC